MHKQEESAKSIKVNVGYTNGHNDGYNKKKFKNPIIEII